MTIKFIANLRHCIISPSTTYQYPDKWVTNEYKLISEIFSNKHFAENVGILAQSLFSENHAFVYSLVDDGEDSKGAEMDRMIVLEAMEYFKSAVSQFDMFLWFAKDNSVCFSDAYAHGIAGASNVITSFAPNEIYSNSNGEYEDVIFTDKEIQISQEICDTFNSLCSWRMEFSEETIEPLITQNAMFIKGSANPKNYNEGNRIERAFRFIRGARASHFLPYKIAMYIPAFECLFSTDATEISHKVSERVAFYLAKHNTERIRVFDIMKQAYNIRSRYLHGALIDKKQKTKESQAILATEIDSLARQVLTQIIMRDSALFLQNDNDIEKYFKELIFQ